MNSTRRLRNNAGKACQIRLGFIVFKLEVTSVKRLFGGSSVPAVSALSCVCTEQRDLQLPETGQRASVLGGARNEEAGSGKALPQKGARGRTDLTALIPAMSRCCYGQQVS